MFILYIIIKFNYIYHKIVLYKIFIVYIILNIKFNWYNN